MVLIARSVYTPVKKLVNIGSWVIPLYIFKHVCSIWINNYKGMVSDQWWDWLISCIISVVSVKHDMLAHWHVFTMYVNNTKLYFDHNFCLIDFIRLYLYMLCNNFRYEYVELVHILYNIEVIKTLDVFCTALYYITLNTNSIGNPSYYTSMRTSPLHQEQLLQKWWHSVVEIIEITK